MAPSHLYSQYESRIVCEIINALMQVLIVGRPNVGKSSLFNIWSGRRLAIVSEKANTTRDVIEYIYREPDSSLSYMISDSGGMNHGATDRILADVNDRVADKVKSSDLILFMIEYDKLTTEDEHITRMLRKSGKPVWIVVNKCDNEHHIQEAHQHLSLGFEWFYPVSCSHKKGTFELLDAVTEWVRKSTPEEIEEEAQDGTISVALIWRPNVGKSSIFNALTWENKVLVHDEWGTTRDSIDTRVTYEGRDLILIDTAWLRKPGKIGIHNIESWSVLRTSRAIDRADVCAVIFDPIEGITQNDKRVLSLALEAKKGIILVLNKWDLAVEGSEYTESETYDRFIEYLQKHFPFVPWCPTVTCIATEANNVTEILEHSVGIYTERNKRIKTSQFNDFVEQITLKHTPRWRRKSHNPRIYYGSQVATNPPKFVLSVNNPSHFHFSWQRYFENQIREFFGFFWTPIDIEYRPKNNRNPYDPKQKDPIEEMKWEE